MIRRFSFSHNFRLIYKLCKSASSIVVWILMLSCILTVPLLCIFTLPLLTSSHSSLAFMDSKNSLRQEKIAQRVQPERYTLDHASSQISFVPSLHAIVQSPPEPAIRKEELYLLVDTSRNRLFVKQKDQILYTAIASTGKGNVLIDPQDPNRQWTFETPKGQFTIVQKLKNPVWIRPDWAFIEQGEPIPDQMSDRLMPGVLGAYALGFGEGYFIHGALYSNLLGQDVTHGCIQLHPQALQYVFDTIPLGTPLIII